MITIESYLAILLTAVTIVGGLMGIMHMLRRDRRELEQSKREDTLGVVELLRAEVERLVRELETARQERGKLEARITEVERDYRTLVLTVTTMGFCARAEHCPTRDAGDRRDVPLKKAARKVKEGTS